MNIRLMVILSISSTVHGLIALGDKPQKTPSAFITLSFCINKMFSPTHSDCVTTGKEFSYITVRLSSFTEILKVVEQLWSKELYVTLYCPKIKYACAFTCEITPELALLTDVKCWTQLTHTEFRVIYGFPDIPSDLKGSFKVSYGYYFNTTKELGFTSNQVIPRRLGATPVSPLVKGSAVTLSCLCSHQCFVEKSCKLNWKYSHNNLNWTDIKPTRNTMTNSYYYISNFAKNNIGYYKCYSNGGLLVYRLLLKETGDEILGCPYCDNVKACIRGRCYDGPVKDKYNREFMPETCILNCPLPWFIVECKNTNGKLVWLPFDPCEIGRSSMKRYTVVWSLYILIITILLTAFLIIFTELLIQTINVINNKRRDINDGADVSDDDSNDEDDDNNNDDN